MGVSAVAPQRIALRSDAARISELMRSSILDLYPRFYDERQTASAAVHIGRLDMTGDAACDARLLVEVEGVAMERPVT